jgi:hypothetical protein
MLNLPHQQVTADIAFPRVETADIEAVVVEAYMRGIMREAKLSNSGITKGEKDVMATH